MLNLTIRANRAGHTDGPTQIIEKLKVFKQQNYKHTYSQTLTHTFFSPK